MASQILPKLSNIKFRNNPVSYSLVAAFGLTDGQRYNRRILVEFVTTATRAAVFFEPEQKFKRISNIFFSIYAGCTFSFKLPFMNVGN